MRLLIVLVVLGAWGVCARGFVGGPPVTQSVEWAVLQSEAVVRGNVLLDARRAFSGEVVLEVMECLKGDVRGTIRFFLPPGMTMPEPGGELVVFLGLAGGVRPDGSRAVPTVYRGWMFGAGAPLRVNDAPVYRMDLSAVSDAAGLLGAVREAVAYGEKHEVGTESASVPLDARAGPRGGLWVTAPADGRLLDLAKRWAGDADPWVRIRGVAALRPFYYGEGLPILRGLLRDPYYEVVDEEGWTSDLAGRARKVFPVRHEAKWSVEEAEGRVQTVQPYLRYGPVDWRRGIIWIATIAMIAGLWPRRGAEVGAAGWVAVACFAVLAGVGVMAWRGRHVADTFSYARGGADWEVTFARGRVAVMRVQNDAPPHPVVVRRYAAGAYPDGLWYRPFARAAVSESGWGGFRTAEGFDAGGDAFRSVVFPYWMLAAAFGAWPAWVGWGMARGRLRRRAWAAVNRCGRCGYDLRGLGGRCPECGAGVRVIPRWRRVGVDV